MRSLRARLFAASVHELHVGACVALAREVAAQLAALAQVGQAHRRLRRGGCRGAPAAAFVVAVRARRDERDPAHHGDAARGDHDGEQDSA